MNDNATSTDEEPKHQDVLDALQSRNEWARRQQTWYQMRHDGLRRRNKPWANAADMHFPLADMLIEKLKPTYIAQIFATDTIASFVAQRSRDSANQGACGQWFDYLLKQRTDLEDTMPVAVDTMLQSGKGIVKVLWNTETKSVEFEACNPMHIIVPAWTERIQNADWIVHVKSYSVAAYKRLPDMDQSAATLQAITDGADDESHSYDQIKDQREGVTRASRKGEIIIWEMFVRQGQEWRVKTYSPSQPTLQLRPEFALPYNKGIFAKAPPPPFAEFNCEKKERGYYSGRGICERVMSFEVSLCKDWNTLKDYQTLTCSPLFSAESGVPQNANLRMAPGQILPFKLQAVTFPPAPMDVAQSMNGTRQLAEQLVAIPDAGVARSDGTKDKRTAAEVNLIGSIMGRNDDLRSRYFRREIAHLLNLAWGLALQYAADELAYYIDGEVMTLDAAALAGEYRIEPNGSGDNFNRGLVLQRAIARKQMFTNSPNIDQAELDRSVLEADDPRLVKRLLINAGSQAAMQQEDQAQEIVIMLEGFPAEVRPTDDDWAHIQSCIGFVQRRATIGEILTPENLAHLAIHIQAHAAQLQKKQPEVWKQRGPAINAMVQALQQEIQAAQAPMPPADNVITMGGQQ